MPLRLPPSVKNWISLAGATIALITLFMIVFLFVVTAFLGAQAAYLGLVVYILLPSVMLGGLLLIPLGMWLTIRRERRREERLEPGWPRIDLNIPHQRNAALIFVIGTTVLLFLSAIGSYEAFHYTESTQFCGQLCHVVMEPEFAAHGDSPHARVVCVECHVGPGADWYVRSKLSGLYQVYAVLTDGYPRPIPTPIEDLRPARAVCEQCHWPQKFYSYTYRTQTHFLPDDTRWDIGLTLKVGAPHYAAGFTEGIHWHIHPGVRIEYIPADERRERIAEVRYTNLDTGAKKIFRNSALPPAADGKGIAGKVRVMDCIDCHNRPSHRYRSPSHFVNQAMAQGAIPADLPGVKAAAVTLCEPEYATLKEVEEALREGLLRHFRETYPEMLRTRTQAIEEAIAGLQAAYKQNIFPAMKVRWSAYPEHSGHLIFDGCFRCHNSAFTSAAGEAIPTECDLCHLINSQGPPDRLEVAPAGKSLEFRHPVDIGEDWKEGFCTACHTGLLP